MGTTPVFHTILPKSRLAKFSRGHVSSSFLTLVLELVIFDALDKK